MKNPLPYIILAFIALLPLLDLLHPGIPRGHDTPDHVARIANFYLSLSEGNLVPRWAGNLNWGYGHPILMFLYPLPSYIASVFHAIGFSFIDSTKLVFAASYLASILAMFLFAKSAWGLWPGFVAAVLYGFAPYRFVDLYVRGALGEHVAFIFPPLILYGLLQLAKNNRRSGVGAIIAISMAGLILSHNAVALMMLPLVFLYSAYLVFFEVKDKFRFLVLGAWCLVLGFLLSAFFWMPAFFEGKYTLRDIVTKGDVTSRFVPWQWFFISPWNYGGGGEFTKELGAIQWIGLFGSAVLFIRTKARTVRWFIVGCIGVVVISLFLMTAGAAGIWQHVTILQKFQFPWRLLNIPAIVIPVVSAMVLAQSRTCMHRFAAVLIALLAVVSTVYMWRSPQYVVKPDEYYRGIYNGTTDTGESSPIWSIRFMEKQAAAYYEVVEGTAAIQAGPRNSTRHEFTVSATTPARIVDNTLYFPGWTVTVNGKILDSVRDVLYQDPNYRGLMTFRVPSGDHRVVVHFGDTKLRKVANSISLMGLLLLLIGFAPLSLRPTSRIPIEKTLDPGSSPG
ncbi:hypothetical protein HY949_02965 [Candidatus Gottesmanbacteria bacterium]|nr:hypothetical protein [Candidatus Gottesmanbacteria bacterium]